MTYITQANVIGKSQNRTALGMMAAYLKMHPQTTLMELKTQFPKQRVCPDAGVSELFYTADDIAHEKQANNSWFINDNACFTKNDEWLVLGNGQKVAFSKMWTAASLARLQKELSRFDIYGEVGKVSGNHLGYHIDYEYAELEEASQGLPIWVWAILAVVLAVVAYFAYDKFTGTNQVQAKAAYQTVVMQKQA